MADLTTDEGTKTPEQIAHESLEDVLIEVNANVSDDLDIVARYLNKDVLVASRTPEKLWNKMQDDWRKDAVSKVIHDKAKVITDYMDKKERDAAAVNGYIELLVSQGHSFTEARKIATGKEKQ